MEGSVFMVMFFSFSLQGMGHSSDPEEMDHVKSFLKKVFDAAA